MALFNWFSGKSALSKSALSKSPVQRDAGNPARVSAAPAAPGGSRQAAQSQPPQDPINRGEQRKAKRHARREQLYAAVRQAMTRAGVLSASYKFKVLSLDQRGDQFLVMMDVHPSLAGQVEKLSESESLIVQNAKTQFGMTVTSVYWRLDVKPHAAGAPAAGTESRPAQLQAVPGALTVVKAAPRFEPIEDDEVTAFKRALAAAAATSPAALDVSGKMRSGLRSYTLITGFEDTEMPESSAAPALSATQYGELR